MFFLWELKEEGMLVFKHIPGQDNEAYIFTNNDDAATLHGHMVKLCGNDGVLKLLRGLKP